MTDLGRLLEVASRAWIQEADLYGPILLMASLTSVTCGVLGVFLILRRMAMVGDAVSHAVLPGLVLAFLASGSRAALPLWIGAVAAGVLAAAWIEVVHRRSRVREDAATGIVLSVSFAAGVLMISLLGDRVDLDQECVLYGEIAWIPFAPRALLGGIDLGPAPLVAMAAVCALTLGGLALSFKQVLVTSFDPLLARAVGLRPERVQLGLMIALAGVVVTAFESVGAVLVLAMLLFPGATALLCSDRLLHVLALAALHGILSSALGLHLALWLDASIAGCLTLAGAALFALALLVAPGRGLLWRGRPRGGPPRRGGGEGPLLKGGPA